MDVAVMPEAKQVLVLLNRIFKGCTIGVVGTTRSETAFVIEGVAAIDVRVIEEIAAAAGACLGDVRVWGVGYVPAISRTTFGLGGNWQPLTVEVVLRVPNASAQHDDVSVSKHQPAAQEAKEVRATDEDALRCIKDSNIRRSVRHFIDCMAMGERPDVYRFDLGGITYLAEKGEHFVMFDAVPTLGLTFLRNARYLLPSIRDIKFERKAAPGKSDRAASESATVMIVTFADTPATGQYMRDRQTGAKAVPARNRDGPY